MNTKFILTLLIATAVGGCSYPSYLPTSGEIDVNQYGSHIDISSSKKTNIKGELISIDSNKIIVLLKTAQKCRVVSIKEVEQFTLRYAEPPNYSRLIPLYSLWSLSHGRYLLATLPVNLIVTIWVTASGNSAFTYSRQDMTYEKLKMFARFPQGVPLNVSIASIR